LKKFNIKGNYIELVKLLKASGLCESGGAAKVAVEEGLVKVDGQVEYRKSCKIRNGQKVLFMDQEILIESGLQG
jgi:ribosome-associated protein